MTCELSGATRPTDAISSNFGELVETCPACRAILPVQLSGGVLSDDGKTRTFRGDDPMLVTFPKHERLADVVTLNHWLDEAEQKLGALSEGATIG